MHDEYLTRRRASEYIEDRGLPCKASTLAKWASTGGGPPYRRFGGKRVVYSTPDLDRWIEERLRDPHTGEIKTCDRRQPPGPSINARD
jgi:hypothetical protein